MITIQPTVNGFIVINTEDNNIVYVFEYPENEHEDSKKYLETEQRMLYTIKEMLGLFWSKHDKNRLFIEIVEQKQD